ncbi:MAG: HD-GYP domain-containing protein [Planctomycetes bacterium]|nr:HD-GYP domain-containing protein [Planctomycetota bacterium]
MQQKIKSRDLKIGMYVIIPTSWMDHPFFRREFLIKTQEHIEKIKSCVTEVVIDTSKGDAAGEDIAGGEQRDTDSQSIRKGETPDASEKETPVTEGIDSISHGDVNLPVPENWNPDKFVSEELRDAIHDKSLSPQEKAHAVYDFSLEIMHKLIDNPTIKNIETVKGYLCEVVDVILSENKTASHLLKITSHDFYTYTHSVNVGILSVMLSKVLVKNYDEKQMRELGAGFFLHDLGKVKIDSAIINKPGKLTKDEMGIMRTHPYQGYKLLEDANQLTEDCKIIVMQHHERENGAGYPRRLKGDEIHLFGRICCIADVYDALTAQRSYKTGLTPFEALTVMKESMIDHFHKEIFKEFVLLLK